MELYLKHILPKNFFVISPHSFVDSPKNLSVTNFVTSFSVIWHLNFLLQKIVNHSHCKKIKKSTGYTVPAELREVDETIPE